MRRILFAMVLSACATEPGSQGMGDDSDDDPLPVLPYRHYVIDNLTLPSSSAEATAMGLDLDVDGDTDNKLGNVITTLATLGVDAKATVTRSIDRGETIMLARIGTTSFQNAPVATFQTYAGADPSIPPCSSESDTSCRKHLQGGTSFTAAADPAGKALRGTFEAGRFYATGGELVVRVALLGSEPIDLVLMGSKAELTMTTDTSIGHVILGGAVSREQIDAKVIPAVHQNLSASVAADCSPTGTPPDCGCASGSNGKSALGMFDKAPTDCSITLEEVFDNSLVSALLAPDVNIDGTMALSLGVTATAVTAAFTAPE
jgi:hypothetical protein